MAIACFCNGDRPNNPIDDIILFDERVSWIVDLLFPNRRHLIFFAQIGFNKRV